MYFPLQLTFHITYQQVNFQKESYLESILAKKDPKPFRLTTGQKTNDVGFAIIFLLYYN